MCPASSGVAADHLIQLLRDRAAVVAAELAGAAPKRAASSQANGASSSSSGDTLALQHAVASLHAAFFSQGPYLSWRAKSDVRVLDVLLCQRTLAVADGGSWVLQLAELCLYFALWTEAANLRHTPELLWLLYHMLRSSANFNLALALLDSRQGLFSLHAWMARAAAAAAAAAADAAAAPDKPGCDGRSAGAGAPAGSPRNDVATAADGGNGSAHVGAHGPQPAADDADACAAVWQHGFVRGLLLPVRNTLGNAARVGALLEEGPGPYATQQQQQQQQQGPGGGGSSSSSPGAPASWWSGFSSTALAQRQLQGLQALMQQVRVRWLPHAAAVGAVCRMQGTHAFVADHHIA
jgi:hypothetical protein